MSLIICTALYGMGFFWAFSGPGAPIHMLLFRLIPRGSCQRPCLHGTCGTWKMSSRTGIGRDYDLGGNDCGRIVQIPYGSSFTGK